MVKTVGGLILNLAVAAAGIKLLMFVAEGYIRSADPSGSFYNLVTTFTGIGDLPFIALAGLAVLLVPYWIYKHISGNKQ
jgi:hypothetical protein